jgi:hypothetical protein
MVPISVGATLNSRDAEGKRGADRSGKSSPADLICFTRGDNLVTGFTDRFPARLEGPVGEQSGSPRSAGRQDGRRASDGPIPPLSPLMAFVGGALVCIGALSMVGTFKYGWPIWMTVCGFILSAGGWAVVLIAIIPWLAS